MQRTPGGRGLRGGGAGPAVRLLGPGALRGRHQEQIVVIDHDTGRLGVAVRVRLRGARLFGSCGSGRGGGGRLPGLPACVLRLSLARDLAGVGHAYPSPIDSAPYHRSCARVAEGVPFARWGGTNGTPRGTSALRAS
ncbi:hypothetical protein GCM10017688_61980 [Streptomyces ramulosus]